MGNVSSTGDYDDCDSLGESITSGNSIQSLRVQNDVKPKTFDKKYKILSIIGEGSMGTIYRVKKRKTTLRHEFALKTLTNDVICETLIQEMKNEIFLLKQLDHPNILRAYETFDGGQVLGIVMELCTGGDLHSRIPYKESDAARIMNKVLSAVQYMHSKNIIHRDIKLENIMFESSRKNADVKLIDFGLAKKFMKKDEYMTGFAGTDYTMAPEVHTKEYTTKADLWSIGVTTFVMLSGKIPSQRKLANDEQLERTFCESVWNNISKSAKIFIFDLLNTNPDGRPNAGDALHHQWFENRYPRHKRISSNTKNRVDRCLIFQNRSGVCEMKKLAMMVIAHNSTAFDLADLKRVFTSYDTDGDGVISYDEFKAAFAMFDISEEEVHKMFHDINFNGDDVIEYTEFIGAALAANGVVKKEVVEDAFSRIDANNTKQISVRDLKKLLGDEFPEKKIKSIISEVDTDQDGKIGIEEFYNLFRTVSGKPKNYKNKMSKSRSSQQMSRSRSNEMSPVSSY